MIKISKSSFSLNLHAVEDMIIYQMAQIHGKVIIISKDSDFAELIEWYGSPPKLILIKFGIIQTNYFGNS